MPMRRILFASALSITLAGCATRPQQEPPVQPTPQPQQPAAEPRRLMGRTMAELLGYFGQPDLQVREGTSLKVQFRGRACILDAYLYPSGNGELRVTHVDTRLPTGAGTAQAACIAALESSS